MKKSNWREELDAPSAVKKTINEFIDGGAVTVPTAVVATKAVGTSLLPWALGAGALGLTAAAVATKGKKKKKKDSSKRIPSDFKTITTKNPQ